MKINLLVSLAAVLSFYGSTVAQSKIDMPGRALLRQQGILNTNKTAKRLLNKSGVSEDTKLRAFITLQKGYSVNAISQIEGVEVQGGSRNRFLVQFPKSVLKDIENEESVASIQLERPLEAKMDLVRSLTGIDAVHNGLDLPHGYTGKDVICALVDGGFDPNHVNFLKDDGTNRIENFTYFRPLQNGGANPETYGADYMPNIDTESSETFHGTHTMGIMAGSYRGKVNAGILSNDQGRLTATTGEIDNPYYGVAPDAALSVASGAGTDYYVALGINQILNYAYWKADDTQKTVPVVLNLSLGSNVGPHDGSSMLCQYIDQEVDLSQEDNMVSFIPVIASGNEGDIPLALHKTLGENDLELKSAFLSKNLMPENYPHVIYGQVYIYSDSDEPFEVQAVMINKERGKVALQNALGASPEGAVKYFCSSNEYIQDSSTDNVSPLLAKNFEGYMGVMAQFDETESGRYMSIIDMMLWETPENGGKYCIGFIVKGKPGQRIDAYSTGDWFDLSSHDLASEGYLDGMTDGSISDVACGHNVVVVGSYNARNYWANIDGTIGGYDNDLFSDNKVSSFTSWGTLTDGRSLPHVCAPGAAVISSSNEYYINDNGVGDSYLQATYTANNRRYSWHQCVGTSMATPVVSGSIALWLEANPSLTVADVRDIIANTAKVDADVLDGNQIQWGAGKFDAYAGLKEVLHRAAVENIYDDADSKLMIHNNHEGILEVALPGADSLTVRLYTPAGILVRETSCAGYNASLEISSLQTGIYIVNVNNRHSAKITLK